MESQAVDTFKQGLHVSGAFVLLLGGGLFDWPFDKLPNTAATEVSERAVHRVNNTVLTKKIEWSEEAKNITVATNIHKTQQNL